MSNPSLSVVMPNYNHAHYLPDTLNSILGQSVRPDEFIVVDDGSTDESVAILQECANRDPLVRAVFNDRNRGGHFSVERGLALCTSEYLFTLAVDDFISPEFIEKEMNFLAQYPQAGLCMSDFSCFDDESGKKITKEYRLSDVPRYFSPDELACVMKGDHIGSITSILKRSAVLEAGGYLESLKWYCDWFTNLVVGFRYGVCYIPENFGSIRVLSDSYSAKGRRDSIQQKQVLQHLLSLLKESIYQDVLPYFVRGKVLNHFGDEIVRVVLESPEHWDIQSLLLIHYPFWKWHQCVQGTAMRAERINRYLAVEKSSFSGVHGFQQSATEALVSETIGLCNDYFRGCPGDVDAHLALAFIYASIGDDEQTIEILKRAKSRFSSNIAVQYALAIMFERIGRVDLTEQMLEGILKVNPTHTRALKKRKTLQKIGNLNGYAYSYSNNRGELLSQTMDGAVVQGEVSGVNTILSISHESYGLQKVQTGMSNSKEISGSQCKVSVVTPTKNCAQYIRGCIESVLAQNYDNFEHIIVDGASTDNTVEILKEYPHLRWISEPDSGEAEALNKALAMADGEIISWLNADDNYFGTEVFQIVASNMNAVEGRHFVYGKTLLTDEQQAVAWLQIPRVPITLPILMRWFDLPELYQPSIFYSKELVQTIGKYREDLFFSIDYEYWLRIAAQGFSFHFVDHVLSQSRLFRESGKSALPKKEQEESWTETATTFQHHLSEVERIHFWKDYYRYRLPYLMQSKEPITPPDDEWAQIGLAFVLRGCGVNSEVVKLLQETTMRSPHCSDAYWLLGDELLRGTKDYDRAKPILEQAQALTWQKQQEAVKGQTSNALNPTSSIGEVRLSENANQVKGSVLSTSKIEEKYARAQDRPLRVLFQNRPNAMSHPGGDTLVMSKLKDGLEQLGVHVDIALGQSALNDCDLVHLFNFATPEYTEQCARDAVQAGIPFVVTALFEDWPRFLSKCSASIDLFKQYFSNGFDEQKFATYLNQIRGLPSAPPSENSFVAQHAACLFASGDVERRRLLEIYPDSQRVEVVKFGMNHLNADVGPELFCHKYNVTDYILCVGRLETRKNQLMLLKALQHEQLPIVFVTGGVKYQPEYDDLCRRFPRKALTLFVDRLSDEMLASCYRGAKVFCLPSWYELPGIVTIEAARFGCAVAATSWGTLKDYLPDGVHYCEPDDPTSIREAVLQAMKTSPPQILLDDASQYTWRRTVEQLVGLYHDILSQAKESTVQDVSLSSSTSHADQSPALVMDAKLKDAREALSQGRIEEAKLHLENLFHQHPTHSEGWLVSGVLFMQHKSFDEAVDAFGKALRFGGDERKCRIGLAMAYMGQSAADKAQAALFEVLRDHPDDEEAIHWLVRACTALCDWEQLENSLSYFIQRNPGNCAIRFALASVQVKQSNIAGAKVHLGTLQLLSPKLEGLHDLRKVIENFEGNRGDLNTERMFA